MATKKKDQDPVLARHRQASHEYHIIETYEAGIELLGTEVKALRAGRATLREGYVRVEKGQAWLHAVNIPPYEQGGSNNHDPVRPRRLLLHKREIAHLAGTVSQMGFTMVPLKLYLSGNKVKLEFAVVRGKKLWDKRQDIAKRDAARDADRASARLRRG